VSIWMEILSPDLDELVDVETVEEKDIRVITAYRAWSLETQHLE
jgi:hypothetical protein